MFQDILALSASNDPHAKSLDEQFLFAAFNSSNSTDLLPSMSEQSLEQHSSQMSKKEILSTHIKKSSLQKPTKEKKKRIRKYTSNNPKNMKGHWTVEQNLKYHEFLELHALHFIDNQKRKTDKIFKSMANFIETRQAHQCRSHHQKIEKKWGSFLNILSNLRLQNFRKTDPSPLIKHLQLMGFENPSVIGQYDLSHEEQLYQKLLYQSNKEIQSKSQQQKTESFIDQQEGNENNLSRCHKKNCMCLMMSETYEDLLKI